MPIISLPLTNQLTNGSAADGGQVLADLNAIASQVNANAAGNGVNSDITQLTALQAVSSGVTASGWTLAGSNINGCFVDSTTTGVTQLTGTSNTSLATTAFVTATAFSNSLPGINITVKNQLVSNNGSIGLWTNKIATSNLFVDSTDATKQLQINLSSVASGTTVTATVPSGVSSINLMGTPDYLLQNQGII